MPTDLSSCLPDYAIEAISEALLAFVKQIQGFDMNDAVLTGVEIRTSSPIRINAGNISKTLIQGGYFLPGKAQVTQAVYFLREWEALK